MLKTTDLRVEFLGINPIIKDKTGQLTPEQIVALSALLTFKGKTVKQLYQQALDKGQNIEKKVLKILEKSSLRGHASIATTPVLSFTYSGSKMLDSLLTGIVFSSSLMASGRRTDTTTGDIVFPSAILKKPKVFKLYQKTMSNLINFCQTLIKQGIKKDIASHILPYGIFGTGIISLPVESLVSFKREWQLEKEWMPEEATLLLQTIEKKLDDLGIKNLYQTRLAAPRNTYSYPNIFKNPQALNQIDELKNSLKQKETVLIRFDYKAGETFKKEIKAFILETKKLLKNRTAVKKNWYQLQLKRRRLIRDFTNTLSFQFLSRVSWRVWGEKKRHRTIPQVVQSIYQAVDEAWSVMQKPAAVNKIDEAFSVPYEIKKDKKLLSQWLRNIFNSLSCYRQMIKLGVKPSDAIFCIPRGVRLKVLQEYNFHNLIAGYYPLRFCSTVEPQLFRLTAKEIFLIKKELTRKKLSWLESLLVPKCHLTGFCPEEEFCGLIKGQQKDYDQKFHEEMKEELAKKAHWETT